MTFLSIDTSGVGRIWSRMDRVWLLIALIAAAFLLAFPETGTDMLKKAVASLLGTLPFILFAIVAVAYLKASTAEGLVARAFQGPQGRMIVMAALIGGLAPFCSCEIIPFIAAMLALGVPLAAVMALWLSSPLMDPAMFSITTSALGLDFAIAKTIAAISIGILGGFGVRALATTGIFDNVLRPRAQPKSCCSSGGSTFDEKPVWPIWKHAERRSVFAAQFIENGLFLVKWLALAYLLEAFMISHVPASWVAGILGGTGLQPVVMGAIVGGPAYMNGYAAVPLVSGLMEQGMSPGAAMSFVLAGGVSCIPAAVAVWALVRPRVFAAYLGFAFAGSILAGLAFASWAA